MASAAGAATGAITLCMDAFWMSPYAFACFVALREKGVPFDVSEVRLQGGEQREPAYRALGGRRIPALGHGDFWLTESSAIVEYVEEAFPPPAHARLFPEAREARARARQLLSWLRSDETLPVRDERSAEVIFYDRPRPPLGPKAAAAAGKAVALAERFLDGNGANLFGAWSIADAELRVLPAPDVARPRAPPFAASATTPGRSGGGRASPSTSPTCGPSSSLTAEPVARGAPSRERPLASGLTHPAAW